ncbi:MAG: glycosyltransferase family 4 protein [Pseudomonadota bacterium]|nr:glycosyltransferase family 4 protein [Pseudomonadota bacterium]
MEQLNWHMANELAGQAEVRAIGPKGSGSQKPKNITVTEAPLSPLPLFLIVSFFKGLWGSRAWKPDVILAGSGLTAPLAWFISKICGARSAAYLHGFDITVNHILYRRLWRPMFQNLDHVIVNSTPTRELAIAAGIKEKKISIVHPGTNLPESPQPAEKIAAFKEKYDLKDKRILLSVGRLTTRKGLREFVEHALPTIAQAEPNTMLVVVGEAPKNSLGASIQSIESIKINAEKFEVARNIKFLGVITDRDQLAIAYEASDVHVFPVRHIPNDPEGFGMVAIEAAAHGLPTAAFATGGVVDAISNGESGYLVEINNYPALSDHVLHLLKHPKNTEAAQAFSRKFSWEIFGANVFKALSGNIDSF